MRPASAPPRSAPDEQAPPGVHVRHTRTYELTSTAHRWENGFEAKASLRTVPLDPFFPSRQHVSAFSAPHCSGELEP